jgi:hypothetical protein
MAFVFQRRLATPLWAMAFFAVALTAAPSATLFLVMALGIAVMAFTMLGLVRWLRSSPSVAQALSYRNGQKRGAAITAAPGARVRTPDDATMSTAEDALDLVRMDDDGGWQMARPPA